MKKDFLLELAAHESIELEAESLASVLADEELSKDTALTTYGARNLRRCPGGYAGPAVLALWRQFAWKPTGSPIKGFELTHEAILDAQEKLVAVLREKAASTQQIGINLYPNFELLPSVSS